MVYRSIITYRPELNLLTSLFYKAFSILKLFAKAPLPADCCFQIFPSLFCNQLFLLEPNSKERAVL
jgi:hypothetical protein